MSTFKAPRPLSRWERIKRNVKRFWDKNLRPIIEPAFIGLAKRKAKEQAEDWGKK